MTPKWIRFLGGTLLAGALALGTVGFVAAQDPGSANGAGMMAGANGAGMMSGQHGAGMASGAQLQQMESFHDQMVASGANGAGMMSGAQLPQMESLHDQMVTSGANGGGMHAFHTDRNPSH